MIAVCAIRSWFFEAPINYVKIGVQLLRLPFLKTEPNRTLLYCRLSTLALLSNTT